MISFFYYVSLAFSWLTPIIYLAGLGLSVWAFRRSRKKGYLAVGAYFAFCVYSIVATRAINHTTYEKICCRCYSEIHNTAMQGDVNELDPEPESDSIDDVQEEPLEPIEPMPFVIPVRTINFPFGPMLLVLGLWLIARRETSLQHPPQG